MVLHARFLEPESIREALRAVVDPALVETTDTGTLSDAAIAALTQVILARGEAAGTVDLDDAQADWEPRFLQLASVVLADESLAAQVLEGGWLDRRGVGARAFGSLPLRIIARQATRETLRAARALVTAGWESELVNVLESAGMRAARAPEEHLVLVRDSDGGRPSPGGLRPEALSPLSQGELWLGRMRDLKATDLTLTVGLPPTAHGPLGDTVLSDVPLRPADLDDVLAVLRPSPEATLFSVASAALGRFRVAVSRERGFPAITVRALPSTIPTLDALGLSPLVQAPLVVLKQGLVLLSGAPGSGRTTLLAALLQQLVADGRHVASLEEPLGLPLRPGPGAARQFMLGLDGTVEDFSRATRLMPVDVVAVDLVDDALGLELALDAAMDGRLALCVFRAPNISAAVHRASVLDARHHRRRLAEGLAALSYQQLRQGTLELDFHLPSVALRRHLRAHETPPPPIVFET